MIYPRQIFLSSKTLMLCHIILITLSNILVQNPFDLFGFHTTWGAFTYPAIFILTDLTTRLSSANAARKVILQSMIPGLISSYVVASYMEAGWGEITSIHTVPLRIAFACFFAYVAGQLLDIKVFQSVRNKISWWFAPVLSATVGNIVDTVLFFAIAFYHSSNLFLSEHWVEIAAVDVVFKLSISFIAFIPLYGWILRLFGARASLKWVNQS